ncbi:MAG: hypothetical protein NVSMB52_04830 [Chloroflexota bacterium]
MANGVSDERMLVLKVPYRNPNLDETSRALWRRAERKELVCLGLYFGSVVAITDILNVRLGVELLTLVVLAAATFVSKLPVQFLRDWWFLLLGLVLWNLSGPIGHTPHFPLHLDFMMRLDRVLFFGRDPVVIVQRQFAVSGHVNVLDVITAIAYNIHLAEPYFAAYFLWRLSRVVYFHFAAASLILLVVGFITFLVFPAVPPWMASGWYGRIPGVTNRFGPVLHAHPLPFHGTPLFQLFHFSGGDAVAAFPSEHAAFPMLEFLAFSRVSGKFVSGLLLGWVVWILFSIVYLGEHWVTDALAGYIYALVIFAFVRRMSGWPYRWST